MKNFLEKLKNLAPMSSRMSQGWAFIVPYTEEHILSRVDHSLLSHWAPFLRFITNQAIGG